MTKTNEEVSFKGEMTHAEFLKAWEEQSAGWQAAWAANDAAFELTMKQKDRGEFDVTAEMAGFWGDEDVLDDDSLWVEDDSTLEALLLAQEVNALGVEELNERG